MDDVDDANDVDDVYDVYDVDVDDDRVGSRGEENETTEDEMRHFVGPRQQRKLSHRTKLLVSV